MNEYKKAYDTFIRKMHRNPFFMPSGFEEQEKINISEYKSDTKRMQDKIKGRKRAEKKLHNLAKIRDKCKHPKNHTKSFHIQRGFDIAKKWGSDDIDKTYHPDLLKV